jgi:hypothetical protein
MFKNINLLTGLGLTLLLSSLVASPVKASVTLETKSESLEQINTHEQNHLISQLFGHDLYEGKPQIEWNGYLLGKVVCRAGSIVSIILPDGTHFNTALSEVRPNGFNVLVEEADGRYEIVRVAHPRWISILESDYGWRRVERLAPLTERTAPIWAALEASSSSTTVAPPPTRTTPSFTPVEQETEPVRGLW